MMGLDSKGEDVNTAHYLAKAVDGEGDRLSLSGSAVSSPICQTWINPQGEEEVQFNHE